MGKILGLILLFLVPMLAMSQENRHNTTADNAWISCEKKPSPNPVRTQPSHWLKYDFGTTYALGKSLFWNLNTIRYEFAWQKADTAIGTNAASKELVIDYSIDGVVWKEWGKHTMTKPSLSGYYEGEIGPDFGGLIARYVLVTVVSNYGHQQCSGLGELKIDAKPAIFSNVPNILEDLAIVIKQNPVSDLLNVEIKSNLDLQKAKILITNSVGAVYYESKFISDEIEVETRSWPSGVYNFTIFNTNGLKNLVFEKI